MDRDSIIAIFVAVIGSNALWGFIQFLLQRKDKKEDCSKKIIEMIKKLDEKLLKNLDKDMQLIQQQSSILSRQRDLLLPRLMSGKLEVNV